MIVKQFLITPKHKNEYLYEYSIIGVVYGEFKKINELDLKHPIISGLLERGALIIKDFIEKPIKKIEEKKVEDTESKTLELETKKPSNQNKRKEGN